MIVRYRGTDPITEKYYSGKTKFVNEVTLNAWHERYPYLEVWEVDR